MNGKIVILSGPSGVGKDTVIDAWIAFNPLVERVVTYTTREPRTGEKDGCDYNFVSIKQFEALAESGHFWESKTVHGNLYASPKVDTERLLAEGKVPVLKIDVQGALEVMRQRPDALTIFLMPPSIEDLEKRIRNRATDDEAAIVERLNNAHEELKYAEHYNVQIVNDDIDRVVEKLEEALKR